MTAREALPEPVKLPKPYTTLGRFVDRDQQTDVYNAAQLQAYGDARAKAARMEAERAERNRDMWKGQCERQAIQLEALRMTDARRKDLLTAALYITARDDDTAVLNCTDGERIAELLLDMSGVDLEAASSALGGKGTA